MLMRSLKYIKDVRWCNLPNRQNPDLRKNHALKHIQPALFGDCFPILHGKPFSRDRLKSNRALLHPLDLLNLTLVRRVDTLFDQTSSFETFSPRFSQSKQTTSTSRLSLIF